MHAMVKLAMLLALAGCQQPGPYDQYAGTARRGVAPVAVISTDADNYRAGARVFLRLTNNAGHAFGYNLCRAKLERGNDDDWQQVRGSLGEVCTAELRSLRPGQTATFAFRTPTDARRGTYRIRAELHDPRGGPPLEALSNGFAITRDAD